MKKNGIANSSVLAALACAQMLSACALKLDGKGSQPGNQNIDTAPEDDIRMPRPPNSWRGNASLPERMQHTAVWTGTEIIVWGGSRSDYIPQDTGLRYNPATDTWTPTAVDSNTPSARVRHSAVWTGTEMIIWGGTDHYSDSNTGAHYDPASDTWSAIPAHGNTPVARALHSAVWTGSEMIIWGGEDMATPSFLDSGAKYDPALRSWIPTEDDSLAGTPVQRSEATAIWAPELGDNGMMIIWGGTGPSGDILNTGALYDPVADTWTEILSDGTTPESRTMHTGVWTGSKLVVWGGYDEFGDPLKSGGLDRNRNDCLGWHEFTDECDGRGSRREV